MARVGCAAAVQEPALDARALGRPGSGVHPAVGAHEEEPDDGPGIGGADAAQMPVEPGQMQRGPVGRGLRRRGAEVPVTDRVAQARVRPRTDDEPLVVAGAGVAGLPAQPCEVLERPGQERVEPTADVQRRGGDGPVALVGGDGPPELVAIGMAQPLRDERDDRCEVVQPVDRQRCEGRPGIREPAVERLPQRGLRPVRQTLDLGSGEGEERPEEDEAELEDAAAVRPALEVLRAGQRRGDRAQGRRALGGGQQLGGAEVRLAVHPDRPGGERQRGTPRHRVGPVARLVGERLEAPLGPEATPAVLDDDRVPGVDRAQRVQPRLGDRDRRVRPVVRQALEQHGAVLAAGGPPHVGAQDGPVAHGDRDIAMHHRGASALS